GAAAAPPRPPVTPPRPGDVADMDRAISEHMANDEWEEAARILNGFNQLDIDNRVRGYTLAQRSRLLAAARVNGAAAPRIQRVAGFENGIELQIWRAAAH